MLSEPIDAVVMWVDGSDPAFIDAHAKALEEERAKGRKLVVSAARDRDNGELRYALRGLMTNAPWLRRIHVVTNGQVPDWLEFDGDRLCHVTHRDIFPDTDMLPNFNTFAIESCLHRIPGLSETFLRLSDDFFIGRPLQPVDLLGEKRAGVFVFRSGVKEDPQSRYQKQIAKNAALFEKSLNLTPTVNYAHAPQIRSKALFSNFVTTFSAEIDRTRRHRFRDADDLIPLFLYPWYHMMQLNPDAAAVVAQGETCDDFYVPKRTFNDIYIQALVGGTEQDWASRLNRIAERKPMFFNINDQFSPENYDEEQKAMTDFLERMFPTPIPQERG